MSSDFTVESGAPIKVYGIHVSNGSASINVAITVSDADDNVIHKYELDTTRYINFDTPFMADNGLKIVSSVADAEISATVFHSNLGA